MKDLYCAVYCLFFANEVEKYHRCRCCFSVVGACCGIATVCGSSTCRATWRRCIQRPRHWEPLTMCFFVCRPLSFNRQMRFWNIIRSYLLTVCVLEELGRHLHSSFMHCVLFVYSSIRVIAAFTKQWELFIYSDIRWTHSTFNIKSEHTIKFKKS